MVIFHKRVTGISELALDRFLTRARRAARLKGTVNVLVTSSSRMKSLNRRFRGKDKPTDVLSFPTEEASGGSRNQRGPGHVSIAGEIAISCDIASKNARLLGHSPGDEIKILTLHGLLHIAGHDHEQDEGQMAKLEGALRAKLRLPTGLIERSDAKEKPSSNRRVKIAKSRKRPR